MSRSFSDKKDHSISFYSKFKKSVLITAAAVMIVTSLTATGIASYIVGDESAVYAKSSKDTPSERAEAYYYAQGLVQCVLNGITPGGNITKTKLKAGDIFKKNPINSDSDDVWGAFGTFINSGASNKGSIDCGDNESGIMQKAAASFGVSPLEMVCGIGLAKSTNGTPCEAGSDDNYKGVKVGASKVVSWVNKTLGFDPFTLTDPARYIYSLNSLKGSCTRGITPKATKADAGTSAFSVKAPDGKDAWYVYNEDYNTHTKVKYRSNANANWECIDIIKSINATNGSYVAWQKANGNKDAGGKDASDETDGEASNCKIETLGWLLCPILEVLGNVTDGAYGLVAKLLTVQPIMTTGDSVTIYDAWKNVRSVANVAFVIAFLIIIFSQVTSIGFSNYNIKKMVPRLVMAAILVNVSFWICAVAVDLSNVIGHSVKAIFDGMAGGLKAENGTFWSGESNSPVWTAIVSAVLIGGAAGVGIYVGLSALLPIIVAVVIAIMTVFIVLTARQALIILLVVVSPLAFVAMLLPNTEGWFTKWRQLFQILLLMFPIIAGIFGASALAAVVIMNSSDNIAVQIMGAGVAVIPLALTPIVMKTAGGVLGKIGAFVNNPNKGPFDAMRRGAQGLRDLDKKRMRANRLNPNGGKNNFTKGWRKATGVGTRFGENMKYKSQKLDARVEAAEAGFAMNNKDKADAANIRSATAGANSAASAAAIKTFNQEDARQALGQQDSESTSLQAALRSQEKAGEDQMIKEFQNIHGPKDATALKSALINAITKNDGKGDVYEAQAIENLLDNMGNKGASVMASVVEETDGKMTGEMRTELSRNLGGGTMGRHEALKNWATSTAPEFDENGKMVPADFTDTKGNVHSDDIKVTGKSFEEAKAGVMASEMKLDKVKAQESKLQSEYVHSGSMSVETMQQAVQPQNSSSFEPKDIAYMQKIVAEAAKGGSGNNMSSMKPSSTQEIKVAIDTGVPPPASQPSNPGTLKVEHSYTGTAPAASAPPAPVKPAGASWRNTDFKAGETIGERQKRIEKINRDITGN